METRSKIAKLLVTGATGFVGRALVAELLRGERFCVAAPTRAEPARGATERLITFRGSLADPATWREQLQGCDAVVHLAARTGKARPREFEETNVRGTERLLAAAADCGVRRFVHVSTIAVGYPEKRRYAYARSKEAAEERVRNSALDWAIVRPTIVLGPGAPAGASLRTLAGAPVVPIFGTGRVRVQPIDVGDLARLMVDVIEQPELGRAVLEFGGPETIAFSELLERLAARMRGRAPRTLRVPLGPTLFVLGALEPALLPLLPLTAGQLYAFAYDSLAAPNALQERRRASLKGIDAMLAEIAAHA